MHWTSIVGYIEVCTVLYFRCFRKVGPHWLNRQVFFMTLPLFEAQLESYEDAVIVCRSTRITLPAQTIAKNGNKLILAVAALWVNAPKALFAQASCHWNYWVPSSSSASRLSYWINSMFSQYFIKIRRTIQNACISLIIHIIWIIYLYSDLHAFLVVCLGLRCRSGSVYVQAQGRVAFLILHPITYFSGFIWLKTHTVHWRKFSHFNVLFFPIATFAYININTYVLFSSDRARSTASPCHSIELKIFRVGYAVF